MEKGFEPREARQTWKRETSLNRKKRAWNVCKRPDERPTDRTHIPSLDGYAQWIEDLGPSVMVTLTTPTILGTGRSDHWYLSRWTTDVEKTLYGPSALRLKTPSDRCRWFFVQERSPQKRMTSRAPERLVHYHGFLVLPARPMREDHRASVADPDMCRTRIRTAFERTLRKTPEVFGGRFRFEMLQVRPFWRTEEGSQVSYALKDRSRLRIAQLPDAFRCSPPLLRDHGIMIFPNTLSETAQ